MLLMLVLVVLRNLLLLEDVVHLYLMEALHSLLVAAAVVAAEEGYHPSLVGAYLEWMEVV